MGWSKAVWLCGFVGLLSLGAAIHDWIVAARLRRNGTRTEGTVVKVVVEEQGSAGRPVIRFFEAGGRLIEFSPTATSRLLELPLGSTVPLVYPPDNAEAARVFTVRHEVIPGLIPAFVGAVFLAVAVVVAVKEG